MSTTTITIEDELAEVRRRVDCMQVYAQACGLPRVRRHLDALQHEEAAVRDAARQAPGKVEDKLGQLRTRVDIAEHSLTADLSGDWPTFVAAVEAELDSWDTYLERLQTSCRDEGVGGASAGGDGDRRGPHATDRRRRAPCAGARTHG